MTKVKKEQAPLKPDKKHRMLIDIEKSALGAFRMMSAINAGVSAKKIMELVIEEYARNFWSNNPALWLKWQESRKKEGGK